WEEKPFLLHSCHSSADHYRLFRMGELLAASEAFRQAPPSLTVCAAHAAAHDLGRASDCVHGLADARVMRDGIDKLQALRCIADSFAAKAGDRAALQRLSEAAMKRAMCRVLYADLLTGEERLALFADRSFAWAWADHA